MEPDRASDAPENPDAAADRPEEPLEASVKGIAQGIAGKLKEMAGELLDDEQLEREGVEQQLEGERRRRET